MSKQSNDEFNALMKVRAETLFLRQKNQGDHDARKYLYYFLTHSPQDHPLNYGTYGSELEAVGLQEIHRDFSMSPSYQRPCVIYHHKPSGSTIKINAGRTRSNIQILGERKEEARIALEDFIKPKGFELENTTYEEICKE